MMSCPRCGGSVSATNHACEFCSVQLMLKACPRCFAKMFDGAKHCSHCGASVVVAAIVDTEGKGRHCPRCPRKHLVARLIGDVLLDECPECHGIFVDINALDRILSERRQARAEAILGELSDSLRPLEKAAASPSGPMYIRCPDCDNLMNRRNFAAGSGIIVDVCRSHGTWFDVDELPQIIDFTMSGGLERAARKQNERDRENNRQDRISAQMAAAGPSERWMAEPQGASLLSGLAELISALLRRF